jgi:hypothetical protein
MIIRYNMHGFLSRTVTGGLFAETAHVTVMTSSNHNAAIIDFLGRSLADP